MLKGYPAVLPYYSNLLVDDQGNILVFFSNSDNSANVEIMAFSPVRKALGSCTLSLPQGVLIHVLIGQADGDPQWLAVCARP